MYAKTHLNQHI